MYRYEYETVYTGGGAFLDNRQTEHRTCIERRAAAGWRFVGFVPIRFTGNGGLKEIDLVFEKEADA